MAEYSTFGALDDRIIKDGDVGFTGFNDRIRPDQLQPGQLADSQNMRFDRQGQAQVRKGIELISNPITVGTNALTLPFTLVADDTSVTATQTDGAIVLTGVTATDFPSTGTVNISGVTMSSGPAVNGNRAYTKNSSTQITIADQTYTGSASGTATVKFGILDDDAVNAIYGSCSFSDPNATASQFIIFASNTKAIAVNIDTQVATDIGYPSLLTVSSSVTMLQAFNKVFIFRNGSTALENNLRISTISAATVTGSSNTANITTSTNHNLVTGDVVTINNLGFSTTDPNGSNITITRTGDTTFTYSLTASGDETYTVSSSSIVNTDFTKVASGTYTQPATITANGCSITNNLCGVIASAAHGLKVGDKVLCTKQGNSNLITNQFTQISSLDSFSTIAEAYTILSVGEANLTGGAASRVGSTTEVKIQFDGTDLKNTSNLKIGDLITIASATYSGTGGAAAVNTEQTITSFSTTGSTSNDTLHFLVPGLDDAVSGSSVTANNTLGFTFNVGNSVEDQISTVITTQPEFIRRVSVGLGFTHMPAPPYAVYHQRRLIMPFNFTVDDSADSFTSRGILDEIIASDILDTDTYDQIYAQYRFNAGEADFNVALHSFSEDNLMVFNRNSIHLVANTTTLQGASTKLLTNEVGCVSRQSIQQVGNQVIFLSDNGVYSTQFFDEYNLRGTETPLSEPINTTIQRINKTYWENSVAVYFDNRYFIAVPLDTSTKNNAVLVYNFLNKQWESIDQVNNDDFHISNLLVVGAGDKRGVYAVNDLGGIHKLDSKPNGRDNFISQVGGTEQNIDVVGSLTTRQYTLQSLDRKRWKNFDMHFESDSSASSDLSISAETENPDKTKDLKTLGVYIGTEDAPIALPAGDDVSIRGRIGNRRGYGIQFTINNTTGRPKIRAIEVDGAIAFRSTVKAQ